MDVTASISATETDLFLRYGDVVFEYTEEDFADTYDFAQEMISAEDMNEDFLIDSTECQHIEYFSDTTSGSLICRTCGIVKMEVSYAPEWSCHRLKEPEQKQGYKDVLKNLERLKANIDGEINSAIFALMKNIKVVSTNIDTVRGKGRLGIYGTCLFFVYASQNIARPISDICQCLKIEKKYITKGHNFFFQAFKEYRTKYVEPEEFLPRLIFKLNHHQIYPIHIYHIQLMIVDLKNRSSLFKNKSIPYSVCCGICFCYLSEMDARKATSFGIGKKDFSAKAGLSEITVGRISTEASRLMRFSERKILAANAADKQHRVVTA